MVKPVLQDVYRTIYHIIVTFLQNTLDVCGAKFSERSLLSAKLYSSLHVNVIAV